MPNQLNISIWFARSRIRQFGCDTMSVCVCGWLWQRLSHCHVAKRHNYIFLIGTRFSYIYEINMNMMSLKRNHFCHQIFYSFPPACLPACHPSIYNHPMGSNPIWWRRHRADNNNFVCNILLSGISFSPFFLPHHVSRQRHVSLLIIMKCAACCVLCAVCCVSPCV